MQSGVYRLYFLDPSVDKTQFNSNLVKYMNVGEVPLYIIRSYQKKNRPFSLFFI